jgi:predicted ribosomally synthesized peptide with SipW-like signal peptide
VADHRAPRARRRPRTILRSTRLRALLTLGILLGLGSVGTLAYWTDQAVVTGGSFTSGTLDVKVSGADSFTWSAFALSDMTPGESVAASVPVQNAGSIPFTYSATALGSGGLLPALTFKVYVGGTASNSGSLANADRTGSCSGTQIGSAYTLTTTAQAVIPTADQQSLAVGGSQSVCVVATLPATAGNAYQGTDAATTFTFDAKQVGAP